MYVSGGLMVCSYHQVQYSSLCIIVLSCWSPISKALPTSCICALLKIAGFDTKFMCRRFPTFTKFAFTSELSLHYFVSSCDLLLLEKFLKHLLQS